MVKKRETYIETRPWGKFEQFTHNEISTVKILTIKEKEQPSIQYHRKRTEFWKILSGKAKVRVGDLWHDAKEGDEFYISLETIHSVQGVDGEVKVLEISFGDFDEKDIVRLEDKYGRK